MSQPMKKSAWLDDSLWQPLAQRLSDGPPVELGGCPPASHAYLLAGLVREWPGRLWILHPHARQRDLLSDELGFWSTPALLLPDPAAPVEGELPDPEREAERRHTLRQIQNAPGKPLLLSRHSFESPVPDAGKLGETLLSLRLEQSLPPEEFADWLREHEYEEEPQIYQRHQFARRGGIIDFFPPNALHPVRVEFFGDDIDSLREFDLDTQATTRQLPRYDIEAERLPAEAPLSSWFGKEDLLIALDEDDAHLAHLLISDSPEAEWSAAIHPSPAHGFQAGDFILTESSRRLFRDQLAEWADRGWSLLLVSPSDAEEKRLIEALTEAGTPPPDFHSLRGRLDRGFVSPRQKLALLSTLEIFGRHHPVQARHHLDHQRHAASQAKVHELDEGELVVHADYGIGEFLGIVEGDDGTEELGIEYQDGATLHVPIDQSHLIARYVGLGGRKPKLSKLGDQKWAKLRKSAENAVLDYAAQLLRLQADRETLPAEPHPADSQWMWEFENAFPYTETPDQLTAIRDVKADLEAPRPMDRLICGDVGFGKTEIAIRAAFKVATGGRQVLLLAPTTVLAEQHARTFRERMSDFPVQIALLTRLRSTKESNEALQGLANGSVDIVIGTHRLLSKSLQLKNPGLLIIDEEQRFGVRHKEQLKERFRGLDVLTLSATPIPRTLYLSLMGARDMSTIDTPPPNRLPVTTSVHSYDERLIRNAIRRELTRGGQIFFLHNRVDSIELVKRRINELVPECRVVIGHGQMDKGDLDRVMKRFIAGDADLLLATTIIESGIDIPNANTILIDRADRFGLADLYQLRGRVGRSGRRAYAILLLPPSQISAGDAR
ncbi:MAG: DEAD/DEAH box helicase [Verrucomicrobiales bacterium]